MGTTTKMAIPYPEATGLVKDGWEDMKDIANQVDAKSGLVLINTTSFSAVSSQSINDVFSTNYNNYIIRVDYACSSGSGYMDTRLRVSGSDNSSSNYKWNGSYQRFKTSSSIVADYSSALVTAWRFGPMSTTQGYIEATFYNPFATVSTGYTLTALDTLSTDDGYRYVFGGATSVTTSYTGFTLLPASGTITGSVSVYGVNK